MTSPEAFNPYEPPKAGDPPTRGERRTLPWTEIVVVLAILFLLAGMFASTRTYGDRDSTSPHELMEE